MTENIAHSVEEWLAMSHEEALAVHSRSGLGWSDVTSPAWRWNSAQTIRELQEAYERGDLSALTAAIDECARVRFVMPEWVAAAFRAAYFEVWRHNVGSWDDVLGKPIKKRQRLAVAQRNRRLGVMVRLRVTEILKAEPGTPKDDGLFERVGGQLGIGKTLAKQLWYAGRRQIPD